MQITITAEIQAALDEIDRLGMAVRRPAGFTRAATEGAKLSVQDNFAQLNLARHKSKNSGPGFYAAARESTIAAMKSPTEGTIAVTGPIGIRQRIFGGTIEAKPGKYLAIPVHERVKGLRAREVYQRLGLMTVVNKRTGKGVLVDKNDTVYYALTRKVTQRADATVLPTDQALQLAGVRGALTYVSALAQN